MKIVFHGWLDRPDSLPAFKVLIVGEFTGVDLVIAFIFGRHSQGNICVPGVVASNVPLSDFGDGRGGKILWWLKFSGVRGG
ncbi:hypothetical protein [Frankia sp. CcI49]|uniref:hypothetical protein n=1 Tax=Frankia sp. CcI49 TaxID=1745382 RepID=UPI001056908B|nr:hypothetical protein [Frankia sp. CcI49]